MHIESEHSNIQYHCNQCDYKAKCKDYLKAHIRKIHAKVDNSSSFFCTLCDYKAKKKIELMEHFRRQHKRIDKYRCDECDFTTHNNVNLVRHMERVHMGLSHSCKLCDGVFNRESG